MNQIIPTIKLHTIYRHQGTYLNALILEHQGNNYHLEGRTTDTIHVFSQGLGIYVLTINKGLGYIGMSSYMAPEPDPINSTFLHNYQDIKETLGPKWEGLKPVTIVQRLINYLY